MINKKNQLKRLSSGSEVSEDTVYFSLSEASNTNSYLTEENNYFECKSYISDNDSNETLSSSKNELNFFEEEYYKDIDYSKICLFQNNQMSDNKSIIINNNNKSDFNNYYKNLMPNSPNNLIQNSSKNLYNNKKNNFNEISNLLETDAPLKATNLRPNINPPPPPINSVKTNSFASIKNDEEQKPIQISTIGVRRDSLTNRFNLQENNKNTDEFNFITSTTNYNKTINDSTYFFFDDDIPKNDNNLTYNVVFNNTNQILIPPFGFLDSIIEVFLLLK